MKCANSSVRFVSAIALTIFVIAAMAANAAAQTPTVVYSFKGGTTDVSLAQGGYGVLSQGRNGSIWGAAAVAGATAMAASSPFRLQVRSC